MRNEEINNLNIQLENLGNAEKLLQIPIDDIEAMNEYEIVRKSPKEKRNYQHIWRNVQMRMPVYRFEI